jgi:GTPase SAR1 family protein
MSVRDKKYALFIVGERNSGKSTLIRSLTGCWKSKVYNVRTLSGQPLRAFVSLSSPQEMGMSKKHPPHKFLQSIEEKYGVKRNDYDILISALELVVRNPVLYGYQKYIQNVQNKGFDVRLAVIKTSWRGIPADQKELVTIQSYAQKKNIPIILVDASTDPNVESSKIRQKLYP